MNSKANIFTHWIALLAVAGLFVSLIHYHSEGLECLEHLEEAHIVQNEDYCPICTLVVDTGFETTLPFDGFIEAVDIANLYDIALFSDETIPFSSGRSPPFLV